MASTAVREIGESELASLVGVMNTVGIDVGGTPETVVEWRRQAADTACLLAEHDGAPLGAALVLVGWHLPSHIGMIRMAVLPAHRREGIGTRLLETAANWLRERGATELEGEVAENDEESLGWARRRGFTERGRNSRLVLDLKAIEPAPAEPPPGTTIVSWAEQPELARGMYEVAVEAGPDIPANEDGEIGSFEEWLSRDMEGIGDPKEATFVAVAGSEVVGYAKLSMAPGRRESAFHDLTAVRRAWRGRGIATALKRTQIAWAKENGLRRLETYNEERNEPIRRLNQRHGYHLAPGQIIVRGPLPPP